MHVKSCTSVRAAVKYSFAKLLTSSQVCGKYFQGRGPTTTAYTHSVEVYHHVYMNLENGRVYCLPDGRALCSLNCPRFPAVSASHRLRLPVSHSGILTLSSAGTRSRTVPWTTSASFSARRSPLRRSDPSTPTSSGRAGSTAPTTFRE